MRSELRWQQSAARPRRRLLRGLMKRGRTTNGANGSVEMPHAGDPPPCMAEPCGLPTTTRCMARSSTRGRLPGALRASSLSCPTEVAYRAGIEPSRRAPSTGGLSALSMYAQEVVCMSSSRLAMVRLGSDSAATPALGSRSPPPAKSLDGRRTASSSSSGRRPDTSRRFGGSHGRWIDRSRLRRRSRIRLRLQLASVMSLWAIHFAPPPALGARAASLAGGGRNMAGYRADAVRRRTGRI